MKRRGLGLLTSLLLATILSSGPGVAKERINIIYPSISGLVLGLWVTKEAGLFDKHGLDANLIYIQSASAVMQAMLGGEAPIALSGGKPVVDLGLEGGVRRLYRRHYNGSCVLRDGDASDPVG